MNTTAKTVVFWVVMLATAVLLWQVVKTGTPSKEENLNFTRFLTEVEAGNVAEVTIIGTSNAPPEIRGKFKNEGQAFKTIAPANYPDMIKQLREKNCRDSGQGGF